MILRHPSSWHGRAHAGHLPASRFAHLPPVTDNHPRLRFSDIFATVGVIGMRLTDQVRKLSGCPVVIRGFMAPPLVERGNNFMLTRAPVHSCPFCDDGARWPDDAVPTLLKCDSAFIDPEHPIEVAGELEIVNGAENTGTGLRLVRLRNARWQPAPLETPHSVALSR